MIRLCTNSSYASLQFVAHSFELMRALPEAARVISRPLPHMGCDQAESFLLNYVEVLAGAASTWLLGAEYLAWCPVYGAETLEAMLDKSPVRHGCSGFSLLKLLGWHRVQAPPRCCCPAFTPSRYCCCAGSFPGIQGSRCTGQHAHLICRLCFSVLFTLSALLVLFAAYLQFLAGDPRAAGKALALARRHDLTAAAYSLSKRLAAAAWQSGQMAAALRCALQAQDPQLCAELVAPLIAKIQQQLLSQVGCLVCHKQTVGAHLHTAMGSHSLFVTGC